MNKDWTMERTWKPQFNSIEFDEALKSIAISVQHTFVVILPNNERREVKAQFMEVDGSTLYFEDGSRETILTFGPGYWVWAERIENDQDS